MEELNADFVSYGVVRTHLKECLSLDRDVEPTHWEEDAIEYTREHAAGKLEDAVRSLIKKGKISSCGDIDVHVTLEIECEGCHSRVPVDRALRRGNVSQQAVEE